MVTRNFLHHVSARLSQSHRTQSISGFTLTELLVSIAILGVLISIATPNFIAFSEQRRVIGAGDNLLANMRFAQSEALKRNARVHLVFQAGANWSYNICLTTNCSGADDPLRAVAGTDYRGTSLAVTASPLSFDPKRGTLVQAPAATSAMLSLSLGARNVSMQITPSSQFQLCSTAGTGGYAACPAAAD